MIEGRDAVAPLTEELEVSPPAAAPEAPARATEARQAAPGPTAEEREARARAAEERARMDAARRQGLVPLLILLDRLHPGATDVGGDAAARDEVLRFRHDPALQFMTGDVARVEALAPAAEAAELDGPPRPRFELVTAFLGLTGATSPLPQYFAEEIAQDHHRDEDAGRDFLDLFHHRAISLLARGLLEQDPAAGHRTDHRDAWSQRLLAMLGVDPEAAESQASPGDEGLHWSRLRAAPLLAERALTAAALEAILRDALAEELDGAPLAIEQFIGVRVPIAEPDRTRLGVAASTLGRDLVVGRTVLDRSSTVGVVIGPVGRLGYQRFAVEARAVARLRDVVTHASRGDLEAVVDLLLAPDAAPALSLSGGGGARLGREAWVGGQRRPARIRVGG